MIKIQVPKVKDVIEIFDGATNVEFKELAYCKEVQAELPVFSLNELSVEEWNQKARIQNAKMFIEIVGRQPVNNQEVLNWICSYNVEIAG